MFARYPTSIEEAVPFAAVPGAHPEGDVRAALDLTPKVEPPAGYALVACDGAGHGCVLAASGCVEEALSEWGRELCDIGLDDAPAGLSVWTGRMMGWGPDHSGDYDAELRGAFRPATVGDLAILALKEKPCATCGKPGHKPMDHAGWNPNEEP